jgi:hypothetical protein
MSPITRFDRARRQTHRLGLSLWLVSISAQANCTSEQAVTGYLQYFANRQELLAWRSDPADPACVWLDWPQARRLAPPEAAELWKRLDTAQRQARSQLGRIRVRTVSPVAGRRPDFDGIPPQIRTTTEMPAACLAADRHLHHVHWLSGPPPFVLRLSPAPCMAHTGLVGAGSAILLSPALAVTAAHVVNDDSGYSHCRFRLTPAASPYTAGSPPFGRLHGSVILHGETPASRKAAAADHRVRVQADWALLRIEAEPTDTPRDPSKQALAGQALWPVWIFGDTRDSDSHRVIKIGFPRGARFRTLRQAGGSVSWLAESICPQHPIREFGFESDHGDSGGAILTLPQDHPHGWLQIHSWVSTGQQVNFQQPTTLGPRLDLALYRHFVAALGLSPGR